MKTRSGKPVCFRLWPENQQRIEYAAGLGLAQPDVINSVLAEHLQEWLQRTISQRARQFAAAAKQPVP